MQATHTSAKRFMLASLVLVLSCFWSRQTAYAASLRGASPELPNPGAIIAEVNALRASYGVPPLATNPILMSIAQQEVDGIVAGQEPTWRPYGMTLGQWLIKEGYPLSGDLSLDGYRSENWALVNSAQGAIDQLHEWIATNDEPHMNTMLSQYRSDIGVGVAAAKDEYGVEQIYFVIETALRTANGQPQYDAKDILTSLPGLIGGEKSINGTPVALSAAGYIVPVALSTARPDGDVVHPVQSGQSLWSIAIHYGTTIEKIRRLNNLGSDNTIYQGQKLLVKKGATQPPVVLTATPSLVPSPTLPATELPTLTPTATIVAVPESTGSNAPMMLTVVLLLLVAAAAVAASFLQMKT